MRRQGRRRHARGARAGRARHRRDAGRRASARPRRSSAHRRPPRVALGVPRVRAIATIRVTPSTRRWRPGRVVRRRLDFPARRRARVTVDGRASRSRFAVRRSPRRVPQLRDILPGLIRCLPFSVDHELLTRRDCWRIAAFAALLPRHLASAAPARAQALPGIKLSSQARAEQVGPNHYRLPATSKANSNAKISSSRPIRSTTTPIPAG